MKHRDLEVRVLEGCVRSLRFHSGRTRYGLSDSQRARILYYLALRFGVVRQLKSLITEVQ